MTKFQKMKKFVRVAAVAGLFLTNFSYVPQAFAVNANSTPVPEIKPVNPNGKSVLFDNTHGETSGQADWVIDGGFSSFAQSLANMGYDAKELRKPLDQTITLADLQPYSTFVMAEPQWPLKTSEQQAISDYVQGGGSVLFIGDHYNADRDKNTIDPDEVYNGYKRGGDFGTVANWTDGLAGGAEAAASPEMQGISSSDWLSDTFGVRFRYNALDTKGPDLKETINDAFGITDGVKGVELAAGSTIEITNPNQAYGLVYLPTLADDSNLTGWASAVPNVTANADGSATLAATNSYPNGVLEGGGVNEGALVAIAKDGAGKAAFIGDSSMVEDTTPKYMNEETGKAKSTYDGWGEQSDSTMLDNLVNWLGTQESYTSFDQDSHPESDLPNNQLAAKTPVEPWEEPTANTPLTQAEPWGAPATGYKWWDPSTFAAGSYGSSVDPTPVPVYNVQLPTTLYAGKDNAVTINISNLSPNQVISNLNFGVYTSAAIPGTNYKGGNQVAYTQVPNTDGSLSDWSTSPNYSSNFTVTADSNGNATVVVHFKTDAAVTGTTMFNFRVRQGSSAVKTITGLTIAAAPAVAPVITLKNSSLEEGATWSAADNFVSAVDSEGNALTLNDITVTGSVDTSKTGDYTVTYSYTDPTTNLSDSETAKVTVTAKAVAPVITLKDSSLEEGATWTAADNFVSAIDSEGNALTLKDITVTGSVDTSKAGDYTVTYSYTDPQTQLSDSKTAKVTVTTKAQVATVSVYRLYNPNTGEHFYTTSAAEKAADVKAGWKYESIGWTAPKTSATPIYRLYNPNAKGGDHYYTKSKFEGSSLVKQGWKWDNNGKPVFYSGGDKNVYVAYNPNASSGAHNYTNNSFEQNSLLKNGWKFGAVAWNAE